MSTWRYLLKFGFPRRQIRINNYSRFYSKAMDNQSANPVGVKTLLDSAEQLINYKNVEEFKLNTPEFRAILTDEVYQVQDIFKEYGHEIRVAGGAVRDILLGLQPKDLDFATTATPDEMKDMFTEKNVRMINTSGEKHGTITARINQDNFEITTLRVDEVTDGRRAEVKFIRNWEHDANRRDFTINSMFLDLSGNVYDYCNGLDDLNNRRIRFVGSPPQRIMEDYLRIMRYFRFVGRIARDPGKHDKGTIDFIKDLKSGLDNLSGERIWSELQKTIEGRFGPRLLLLMLKIGLGKHMGFPVDVDLISFSNFCDKLESISEPLKAITVICAAMCTPQHIINLRNRLKFSNFDRDCGLFVLQHRDEKLPENELRYFKKLVAMTQGKTADVRQFVEQLLLYKGNTDTLSKFREWSIPVFPIKGNVIASAVKVTSVKHIGVLMSQLKGYWAEKDFEPTDEELMAELPKLYEALKEEMSRLSNK